MFIANLGLCSYVEEMELVDGSSNARSEEQDITLQP